MSKGALDIDFFGYNYDYDYDYEIILFRHKNNPSYKPRYK